MRWNERIQVMCDGCGMWAGATRHARSLGQAGEPATIELPKTWASGMAPPSLALPGKPLDANMAMQLPANELANRIGQPVPVLFCSGCAKKVGMRPPPSAEPTLDAPALTLPAEPPPRMDEETAARDREREERERAAEEADRAAFEAKRAAAVVASIEAGE